MVSRLLPLLLPSLAAAGVFELTGPHNAIQMGGATLSASCPSVATVGSVDTTDPAAAVFLLTGTGTSCAGVPIDKPCVELSTLAPRPPLFTCTYTGSGGVTLTTAARHANLVPQRSSQEELLAVLPAVSCPAMSLPLETRQQLIGSTNAQSGAATSLMVRISFNGAILTGDNLAAISVSAPQISPPSSPPDTSCLLATSSVGFGSCSSLENGLGEGQTCEMFTQENDGSCCITNAGGACEATDSNGRRA